MRIYRDVRFSKDKRPYKTNVGIHFRHELGKIGVCHLGHDALFDGSIVKETTTAFRTAKPLVAFLCQALGVKF